MKKRLSSSDVCLKVHLSLSMKKLIMLCGTFDGLIIMVEVVFQQIESLANIMGQKRFQPL